MAIRSRPRHRIAEVREPLCPDNRVAAAKAALDGHKGRLGIHDPFRGLDIDNDDPEAQAINTSRFIAALEAADSFCPDTIALSIDTGHARLARRMSGAPPEDYFVRDAGDQLAHVHLQDLDGHTDRHLASGDGEIEWHADFRAFSHCCSFPHLVLELRDKADIPRAFAFLAQSGLVI